MSIELQVSDNEGVSCPGDNNPAESESALDIAGEMAHSIALSVRAAGHEFRGANFH